MATLSSDRVRLRYVPEEVAWDLVLLGKGDEKEKILARFYTGTKTDPGYLAYWAHEHVLLSEKA